MNAENQRSWLLLLILTAALGLSLVVSALVWLRGSRPQFAADDARVRLVFQVDVDESAADSHAVQELVRETLEQRLRNSGDVAGFVVRVSGDDRIEVLTSAVTEPQIDGIIDLLTRPGTLEFALLANQYEHRPQIEAARAGRESEGEDGEWAWVPVAADAEIGTHDGVVYRATENREGPVQEFLIVRELPRMRITGDQLERAMLGFSQNRTPALDFKFDQRGTYLFQQLTAANSPRPGAGYRSRLAIILDGKIHSAPAINEMIGGRGQITGNFSEAEVRQLAAALTAGELPAPVELVEIEYLDEPSE